MADERQATTIRLPVDLYEWVRREAYERHVPQQQVIEEALASSRREQEEGR